MKSNTSQSLLWALRSEQTPSVSYVMGTMHIRDRRAFSGWDGIAEMLAACTVFAAEIHLDELSEAWLPGAGAHYFTPGQNLNSFLPSRRFERLRHIVLKGTGIDVAKFLSLPPIVLAQLIDERLLANDYPTSLDESLWEFAKSRQKQLIGLESWNQQLELLQGIAFEDQVRFLLEIGRHLSRRRRQLSNLATLYEKGDLRQLYLSARAGAGRLRKAILLDRNISLAQSIGHLASGQPTFAAIGAAHLAGGKGVLRLLKQQGFTVVPVFYK